MSEHEIYRYPGKELDVEWDGRLCIHIGECGYDQSDLFVGGRTPWCQPDRVSRERVIEVVRRCPSGALTFIDNSGDLQEQPAQSNTVQVTYNGPLFVQGDLDIEGASDDMPGVRFRAALCRCGQSKIKPFCDNSHAGAGFSDYGAVGESGEPLQQVGGKLEVSAAKDGPLMLSGNLTIIAGSGRVAWQGTQAALCRCGASRNKPFCDGSHKAAGFKSGPG